MNNDPSLRYFPPSLLVERLQELKCFDALEIIGTSVENRPIYALNLGEGGKKVLAWSQMHGNETTSTKACLDLVECLMNSVQGKGLMKGLRLKLIFQLSPDGAERYTRLNANTIDLNRDAVEQSQPEMKALRRVFAEFQPDLCLNLHGQRTIFSAGKTNLPATLSFLAPAAEETRQITPARKTAMQLIAHIVNQLPRENNWGVGRYDDGFNRNCTGDYFTALGTPTILFEAGHYPGDYTREHTRKLFFKALLSCLVSFKSQDFNRLTVEDYLSIPDNGNQLRDIEITNVTIVNNENTTKATLFVQYKEVLKAGRVCFQPEYVGYNKDFKGLKVIDSSDLNQTKMIDVVKSSKNIVKHLESFIEF